MKVNCSEEIGEYKPTCFHINRGVLSPGLIDVLPDFVTLGALLQCILPPHMFSKVLKVLKY